MHWIDLRSDTVTVPTPEMRRAMAEAEVGDDVYGDDPTVRELERMAAKLMAKESALFVPTGTFGNQLALFTHCRRGDEVILGDDCHIVAHEVGGAAVIAGVQLRTLPSRAGVLDPTAVAARIRKGSEDIHYPTTGLVCLENAHGNGRVIPLDIMEAIHAEASRRGVPVHLDGARIFNAAASLGVEAASIARHAETVMFCLSKGLCAPVGSILAGPSSFVERARKNRKLMGGGMRQAGILAAAGLVALRDMRERLGEDHANARLMGVELARIPGVNVRMEDIHINMVFFDLAGTGADGNRLVSLLLERGVKANPPEGGEMRFVTHRWVSREDVLQICEWMKELIPLARIPLA